MGALIPSPALDQDAFALDVDWVKRAAQPEESPQEVSRVAGIAKTIGFPASKAEVRPIGDTEIQERSHASHPTETRMIPEVRLGAEERAALRASLKAEMEDERAAIHAKAREAGYAQGLEAGTKQGTKDLLEQRQTLTRLAQDLEREWQAQLARQTELAAEVAYEAVCKIVGQALLTAEGVRACVLQVISRLQAKDCLRVLVSQADFALLFPDADPSIMSSSLEGIAIAVDRLQQPGGCRVETTQGSIDARLGVQMRRLLDAMSQACAHQLERRA